MNILNWIKNIREKKKIELSGVVWTESNDWGSSIYFFNFKTRSIAGHKNKLNGPKVNDEFRCKMKSGKIGRFAITSIEYMDDPQDQFFGEVTDLGYLGEPILNSHYREKEKLK